MKNGLAFGVSISDDYPLVSYNALSFDDPIVFSTKPSPRYWLLCKLPIFPSAVAAGLTLRQGPACS